MRVLTEFTFPDAEWESGFMMGGGKAARTCDDSRYPFGVLSARGLARLELEPLTILYGGNGSGKTTALNVIAEKLNLARDTLYNRSNFFEDYTALCHYETRAAIPQNSRVITSDDVFDFMLNLRSLNEGIDRRRDELFEEYLDYRGSDEWRNFRLRSMEDYDQLKKRNMARSRTQSRFVRANLKDNVREQSNGESAFYYFTQKIKEDGLYLLDEPENSLSPTRQQELVKFMEDSARFFHCQFVIATHSPFVLAMREAKIYDLDETPAAVRKWTELGAVRAYHDFFKAHEREFE